MSLNGDVPTYRSRMFKGNCPHSGWWVMLDAPFDVIESWPVTCPSGCEILLRSIEPAPRTNPEE